MSEIRKLVENEKPKEKRIEVIKKGRGRMKKKKSERLSGSIRKRQEADEIRKQCVGKRKEKRMETIKKTKEKKEKERKKKKRSEK